MAFLTFNKLQTRTYQSADSLNAKSGYYGAGTKVFLSYRREDRAYVVPVVEFLRKNGANIYIDYLDESLEDDNTSVARQLRSRVGQCKKFISLATPNSSKSKWMPWELGLGDRIVNYENVAVLPLTHSENNWGDQEYGKIYGRIENRSQFSSYESWQVVYPDGTAISLLDWIKK